MATEDVLRYDPVLDARAHEAIQTRLVELFTSGAVHD